MAIKHAKRKVAPKKDAAATSDIVVAGNYKARQHVVENMEYWDENYILKDVNRFPTTDTFLGLRVRGKLHPSQVCAGLSALRGCQ